MRVSMPDGSVAEFPDGMAESEIEKILAQQTTPQDTGAGRLPKMAGSAAVRGFGTGMGMLGDVGTLFDRYAVNPLLKAAFGDNPRTQRLIESNAADRSEFGMPTSQDFVKPLTRAGIVNRPELTPGLGPNPMLERYLDAGVAGVASAVPTLPLGGGVLANLVSGGAGALAGQGAEDLLPGVPGAGIAASMLGGLAAGTAVSGTQKYLAGRAARSDLAASEAAVAKANAAAAASARAAEEAKLAGKTGFDTARSEAQALRDSAIAAATGDSHVAVTQAEAQIAGQAAQHGTSATLQDAGQILQDRARTWISSDLPKKVTESWKPVDALIPAETAGDISTFANTLEGINKQAGSLEPLAAALKPSLPAKLQGIFKSKFASPTHLLGDPIIDEAGSLIGHTAGAPITWTDMQKLRSILGDAMADPVVIRDIGQQNLSRLYASLSGDMKGVAGAVSPEARLAFDAANGETTRLMSLAEGPVSKLVAGVKASASDPLPEVVASRLLSGGKLGASDLAALRAEMPDAVNELTAAGIRNGAWGKLSPEAKAALVPDAGRRAVLDSAHGELVNAPARAAEELAAAKAAYAQAVSAADAAKRGIIDPKSQEAVAAKLAKADAAEALRQAKIKAGSFAAKPTDVISRLQSVMVGGEVGSALGVLGHSLMPGVSELGSGAAGMLIGLSLPALRRMGLPMLGNPGAGIRGVVGGEARANGR